MIRHPFCFCTKSLICSASLAAAAVFVVGALASRQANAQYTFVPNGTATTNWASSARWTGGPAGTFPNAADTTATFNVPLFTSDFTVGMTAGVPTPPGTLTVGELIVNNTGGNAINTSFGTGSLVFQKTAVGGIAKYTESSGASSGNGSTTVVSTITLLSNFLATQDHVDADNPNNGTLFTGLINGGSGITFTKDGVSNLGLTDAVDPTGTDGFFGSYIVNHGALRFIANSLLKNAASFTVNDGGQLQIGGTVTAINLGAGASLKLGGAGDATGPTNTAGALRFQTASGTTTTFSSPIELTSNAEINVSPSGAIANIAAPISGTNFALTTSGSGGTLGLTGTQSNTNTGGLTVSAGTVNLNKGGGATAVAGTLSVGGTSTVVVQQDEQIVDSANVRFTSTTVQGGILRIGGLNRKETVGSINSTNNQSGTIEANNGSAASVATLTIAGAQTSKFDGLIRDNSNTATNPGKLAIAKTGSASLEITSSTNSYSGGTTVSGGSLIVSNTTGSATGTGDVAINNTGTLTGNGIVSGNVTVNAGGHIAPSTSIAPAAPAGLLTVGSANFATATSALDIEIGGAVFIPGTEIDFDRLATTGAATLGGALNVSLINSFAPALNDVYRIVTAGTAVAGTFATTSLPSLASGEAWQVNYGSNYVDLAVIAAAVGLPGDFNSDGKVDAADYVTWRKNDAANATLPNDNGLTSQAARYSLWRTNFGNPGSGSGSGLSSGAVPEPATLLLLVLAAPFIGQRAVRQQRR